MMNLNVPQTLNVRKTPSLTIPLLVYFLTSPAPLLSPDPKQYGPADVDNKHIGFTEDLSQRRKPHGPLVIAMGLRAVASKRSSRSVNSTVHTRRSLRGIGCRLVSTVTNVARRTLGGCMSGIYRSQCLLAVATVLSRMFMWEV